MKPITVVLADDHHIILDGLQVVLSNDEDIEVIGTVENGKEVIEFLEKNKTDLVVLDINMPKMDGITCARVIKKQFPGVKILILTMYPQKSFVDEIVKIGIDGCLLKNNTGKELITAIKRVMAGKSYFDHLKSFTSEQDEVFQFKLTKRELEIIKCIADGLSSIEMAEKLFISEHTVRTHRKNLLKKTGLSNTSQLIKYATEQQIL
ncbi:MAG: response regulator transcription factor [Cyclobacteriaceae bacterium]|nr:response regulator transcription factor [Cyclobacteriaceae bacterium]